MNRPHQLMLVEDSETQAIRLIYVLEKAGWPVTWVNSAARAFDEINRSRPDLILVDYYLPDIRGDELCRRIRMNIDTRGIPIIVLTAGDGHEDEVRGLEGGADDFVPKSVDTDILQLRIRGLLAKSIESSPVLSPDEECFRKSRILTIDDSRTYLEFLGETLD